MVTGTRGAETFTSMWFRKTNYASESATLDITAGDQPAKACPCPPLLGERRELLKRVLLLDDMTDYREVLQEFLGSHGFNVTGVSNGADGLREFLRDPFHLVLCDMMMPKLNGEMFYWAVIRMRPAAGQRFIFLTGHQSQPTIQSFFQRVNAVVLIKPFLLEDLRQAMERVLRKVG